MPFVLIFLDFNCGGKANYLYVFICEFHCTVPITELEIIQNRYFSLDHTLYAH